MNSFWPAASRWLFYLFRGLFLATAFNSPNNSSIGFEASSFSSIQSVSGLRTLLRYLLWASFGATKLERKWVFFSLREGDEGAKSRIEQSPTSIFCLSLVSHAIAPTQISIVEHR